MGKKGYFTKVRLFCSQRDNIYAGNNKSMQQNDRMKKTKIKKNAVKLWINYCAINFSLTMALVKRVHYMLKLPINSTLPLVGGVEVAL